MTFKPLHINATKEDLAGNNGIGRYVFIPGSNGRAKQIAEHFNNLKIIEHRRGHYVYTGTIEGKNGPIDVATVSSGMGCPSMEIILHELFMLGAKRFLRVGTSGSLQPHLVKMGDIVHATASTRDEQTTRDYAPIDMPAVSSLAFYEPIKNAANSLKLKDKVHSGVVHCKSSFYAREFSAGPKKKENDRHLELLEQCGVLASEMETATLFMQAQIYNRELSLKGGGPEHRVDASALLAIVSVPPDQFLTGDDAKPIIKNLIDLAIETIKEMASH